MFIGDLYQSSHGLVVTYSHRQATLLLYVWVFVQNSSTSQCAMKHLHLISFFSFAFETLSLVV